jgi:hypothetical protein
LDHRGPPMSAGMHRTYSQCKAKFFIGKNWVLKRNAYFSAGQAVRWSHAQ